MLLSAVSVLVVAQSSSEIPEGLMNNPVHNVREHVVMSYNLWDFSSVFVSLIALRGLNMGKIFEVNLGEGSCEACRATWILDNKSAFA